MSEGLPEGWEYRQLGEFAKEVKIKNTSNDQIPVLSVTKYDGFVNSLEYFKKQVF
jgi:type I restriction enzyme, S subunit